MTRSPLPPLVNFKRTARIHSSAFHWIFLSTAVVVSILSPGRSAVVKRQILVVTYAMLDGCVTFFSHSTVFIMTVMSIERWSHMAKRSLINFRRACFIAVVLFLLPIPVTVYRVIQHLKPVSTPVVNICYFHASSLVTFLLTVSSVAYFKVYRMIRRHQQQIQANEMKSNLLSNEYSIKRIS